LTSFCVYGRRSRSPPPAAAVVCVVRPVYRSSVVQLLPTLQTHILINGINANDNHNNNKNNVMVSVVVVYHDPLTCSRITRAGLMGFVIFVILLIIILSSPTFYFSLYSLVVSLTVVSSSSSYNVIMILLIIIILKLSLGQGTSNNCIIYVMCNQKKSSYTFYGNKFFFVLTKMS